MIRVVVTGSECTGKSTLTEALARHYGVPWVPEYARRFVQQQGRAPEAGDVEAIARGQMALEDEIAAEAGPLLLQDTDLLSTVVYARHYYGSCPAWIERQLGRRPSDLYLLADIDVAWMPDGAQRDRPDQRDRMQGLFRAALRRRSLTFATLRGSVPERCAAARALIDPLLDGEAGGASGPIASG